MNKHDIVQFFSDCTTEIVKYFNPAVVKSINDRKEQGYHIVVCSGANTLLLNEVANYLKLDTVIGTELYFLEDGLYDYDAPIEVITGKKKPIALLERFKDIEVDWKNSCAYGDSYYDFDIMNLTGNPIAVNPDDDKPIEDFLDCLEPYTKHLDDGIFEVRAKVGSNISRTLFFFMVGKKIILTNGFIKKSQKTPLREIEIAKERRADYLERIEANEE